MVATDFTLLSSTTASLSPTWAAVNAAKRRPPSPVRVKLTSGRPFSSRPPSAERRSAPLTADERLRSQYTSAASSGFCACGVVPFIRRVSGGSTPPLSRSEEHTSELQSLRHLVCRLLLE